VLVTLVDALKRRGLEKIEGADRVAALAYRTGRYDLAATLANRQETALSWWVRAKLALRRGDTAAAVQAYARAAQAFPRNDDSLDPANASLLMGEQGVLTLPREGSTWKPWRSSTRPPVKVPRQSHGGYYGDYAYANDMAYVAERVLTTDELKTYVDAHAPASPMPAPEAVAKAVQQQGEARSQCTGGRARRPSPWKTTCASCWRGAWCATDGWKKRCPTSGRPRRALHPEHLRCRGPRSPAGWRIAPRREHGQALDRGKHAWRASTAPKAGMRPRSLRGAGHGVMGYEQGPDYAVYGGSYPGGAGPRHGYVWQRRQALAGQPAARAQADLPGPLVTDGERQRYAATEAKPYKRFHYRDIAADYVMKSADALPARSQAFAAVLCQGVNFVYYDQPRAEQLYLRYVKEGAAVLFSADFGQNCGAGFCRSSPLPVRTGMAHHPTLGGAASRPQCSAVAGGGGGHRIQRSGAADVRPRQSLDLQLTSSRFNSEMRAGCSEPAHRKAGHCPLTRSISRSSRQQDHRRRPVAPAP
jgi:hypothetical protein